MNLLFIHQNFPGQFKHLAPALAQQGEEKGFYLGELQTLQRQITKRFGPLPEAVQVRLSTATREEIERWLDRVLDAQTLDEVFAK